jgi:hypothetical protein
VNLWREVGTVIGICEVDQETRRNGALKMCCAPLKTVRKANRKRWIVPACLESKVLSAFRTVVTSGVAELATDFREGLPESTGFYFVLPYLQVRTNR